MAPVSADRGPTDLMIRLDYEHRYWFGDQRIPGFTEIASSFFPSNPYWTEGGRDEGTHLHQCCALLAENDLDWASVNPIVLPRVRAFEKFLSESGFVMSGSERPLYVPTPRYACTPDWWGHIGAFSVVIDGKRGAKLKVHSLQTAAQKIALEANGFKTQKRYSLYLKDDGYRLEPHEDYSDLMRWQALVAAYHAKEFYK